MKGIGHSPTSILNLDFEKSDSKIASWYQVALLAGTMSSMKQKQFHQRRLYGCADFQKSNIEVLTETESGKTACLVSIQELLTA